ncbi:MAG: hypothetical protein LBI72_06475 [Flavobacteriaceae bacterium]|jgi:hypothetical protein|nr:hypothetical protein [Flavobacteriaceae bacterium]
MKKENVLVLHSLLSSKEFDAILADTRDITNDNILFDYLLRHHFVLEVNHIDEHQDYLILAFIQKRLLAFNSYMEIEEKKLFKNVSKAISKERINKTTIIPYLISKIKKKMDKTYTICQIKRDDNNYYLAVLQKKKLRKLLDITTSIGIFQKIEKPVKQETVYTIQCSCGATSTWQIKKYELPPQTGHCNSCQKDLFNPQGTPIFAMVIEPLIG